MSPLATDKTGLKQRHEADKKVKNILHKYKKLGLKDKDVAAIFSGKLPRRKFNINFKKCAFVITLALMCAGIYFYYDSRENDECWVYMPSAVTKATRAPEACSMCENVTMVPRLSNLTPSEFEELYAYNGIPIVVTDATDSWDAVKVFDFWFFKRLFTESDLGTSARDCQFFPYKTEFQNLYDVFLMNQDRAELAEGTASWYIGWSNCHDSTARLLRQHYTRPYFLPETAESNAVDWIFMGGPGDGAQMHVDHVVQPSWQAQLKGRKRWFLAPPPECYYACKFLDVTIHPGEMIVLDTNRWYHKTEVLPGTISISIGAEYD